MIGLLGAGLFAYASGKTFGVEDTTALLLGFAFAMFWLREETHKVCEIAGKGGGFIMSPGVGEMEGSNLDLVRVWADATREFGVY